MAGMRELTAEEKAKPYSKYYYRPHAGASPELAPLLEDHKPMDPGEALPIEQMSDLLEPGYLPGETGYCTLPNGGAYVAVRHPMPGVTAEMVELVVRLARPGVTALHAVVAQGPFRGRP